MISVPVHCVVDASVGIKLVVQEADSSIAGQLFVHLSRDPAARFAAQELFDLECGNILWKLVRRQQVTAADADNKLAALRGLGLRRIPDSDLALVALRIAVQYDITEYDACYVAASIQEQAPLITADDKLARKLASAPFSVLLLAGLAVPPPGP